MRLLELPQVLAWCVLPVLGNVEKTVFLGPGPIRIPQQHPNLQDLYLDKLSPSRSTLRLELTAAFPKPGASRGETAWFLVDGLRHHQRYEVRVCWAAIVSKYTRCISSLSGLRISRAELELKQPTSFSLDIFTLDEVFSAPSILTSLAVYSELRQNYPSVIEVPRPASTAIDPAAILFLRIEAAADYYTTNKTLMQDVPPVNVDISKP